MGLCNMGRLLTLLKNIRVSWIKLYVTNALSYGNSRLVKKSKFLVLPVNIRIQNRMLSTNALAYQSRRQCYKTFLSVI
jgi:hypothetical protein